MDDVDDDGEGKTKTVIEKKNVEEAGVHEDWDDEQVEGKAQGEGFDREGDDQEDEHTQDEDSVSVS